MGKFKVMLEMVNNRAKWSKTWGVRVLVELIWGIFDLVVFKVILGHSIDDIVSKWPAIRKQLAVWRMD